MRVESSNLAGRKRERLVSSATDLMDCHGVESPTLSDVASAADIPLGNVSSYCKTPDKLVESVIDERVRTIPPARLTRTPRPGDDGLATVQGAALLSNTLRDPRIMTTQMRRLDGWIAGLESPHRSPAPTTRRHRPSYPPGSEGGAMPALSQFAELVPLDHGLSTVVTLGADHAPHATVVNAGVLPHPVTGDPVVGFVSAGVAHKLAHLRADPTIVVVARAGWLWATVEGTAELIGPDDRHPDVDAERLRVLLREVFQAAGGTHDDWDAYDQVMRDERRAAVLVRPTRTYTNPT